MSTREDLERALQASWSFDELSVYGDHLLAAGDPRGELIALDLHPSPADRAWWVQRRAALAAWLGDELAARAGHLVQHGFIHELRDGNHPAELLDGPLGTVVRGYTTWGHARVAGSLARLASRPRPWLARLAITSWGKRRLEDGIRDELIAATPHLHDLVLAGNPIVRSFPHPAVRRLGFEQRSAPMFGRDRIAGRSSLVPFGLSDRVDTHSIDVTTGRAGPTITDESIDRLRALIEATPDCRELVASSGGQFPEPVLALVVRLAAAGLVEIEGPIVRVATTDRMRVRYWGNPGVPRALTIEAGHALAIRSSTAHVELLRARLYGFRLSAVMQDVLVRYGRRIHDGTLRELGPDEVRSLAAALNALLELRGMSREDFGNQAGWLELEQLVTLLVGSAWRTGASITWS